MCQQVLMYGENWFGEEESGVRGYSFKQGAQGGLCWDGGIWEKTERMRTTAVRTPKRRMDGVEDPASAGRPCPRTCLKCTRNNKEDDVTGTRRVSGRGGDEVIALTDGAF